MVINWYGEGSFKIQTGGATILTDPFLANTGLTPPRFKADIILKTLTSLPLQEEEKQSESQYVIGAGEYEIKDIEIKGWSLAQESTDTFLKTVYVATAEEMRLCFLGHLSLPPEPTVLEKIDDVDILFIPAGGKPFIEQEKAAKLIKQIEPKLVVTSFYKTPGLKRKADDVKEFLKEIEQKAEPQEKLTIKKKDLPTKTQVVVLKI